MMKQGYRREMSHFSVTTVTTVILDDSFATVVSLIRLDVVQLPWGCYATPPEEPCRVRRRYLAGSDVLRSLLPSSSHMCSMQFMSGETAGQSINIHPLGPQEVLRKPSRVRSRVILLERQLLIPNLTSMKRNKDRGKNFRQCIDGP